MRQKARPAVPAPREAEADGNTTAVKVDHQPLIESAGGNSLPDGALPEVSQPNVPLPGVLLPEIPLPEARSDALVGEE
jgi:hypothetical protein